MGRVTTAHARSLHSAPGHRIAGSRCEGTHRTTRPRSWQCATHYLLAHQLQSSGVICRNGLPRRRREPQGLRDTRRSRPALGSMRWLPHRRSRDPPPQDRGAEELPTTSGRPSRWRLNSDRPELASGYVGSEVGLPHRRVPPTPDSPQARTARRSSRPDPRSSSDRHGTARRTRDRGSGEARRHGNERDADQEVNLPRICAGSEPAAHDNSRATSPTTRPTTGATEASLAASSYPDRHWKSVLVELAAAEVFCGSRSDPPSSPCCGCGIEEVVLVQFVTGTIGGFRHGCGEIRELWP